MVNNRTKIAVAGMDHAHVTWVLENMQRPDVDFVGFYEANTELSRRYTHEFNINSNLVYDDLDTMLDEVQPEGVVAFSSIFHHLEVVEACAPRSIHVMVEKPLAVSMEHARKMESLANQHGIHLLTNYETTWYASNHEVYRRVHNNQIGDMRKIVVHDGHQGPQELGCNPEFLAWLTDPILNGGGAIIDFGCYGVNLTTWLTNNQRPISVTAITHTNKPDIYPKVDDESVIILTYPTMQAIIQGSWNWPIARKDMEIYGQTGYMHAIDRNTIRYRTSQANPEETITLDPRPAPHNDPFSYFGAVISGDITIDETDLYGLTNNMLVVEILDAARQSAHIGQRVDL
jgi:scyllo-inositol 2-dehydrogenase (NADP+)